MTENGHQGYRRPVGWSGHQQIHNPSKCEEELKTERRLSCANTLLFPDPVWNVLRFKTISDGVVGCLPECYVQDKLLGVQYRQIHLSESCTHEPVLYVIDTISGSRIVLMVKHYQRVACEQTAPPKIRSEV